MDRTLPRVSDDRPSGWRTSRGFTLIELLIVLALIGIVVAIGIPNLRRARIRANMLEQVRTLKQAAALGRINAIRFGSTVILGMPTGDGVTIRLWANTSSNNNEAYDAGERILHDWVLPRDIKVMADTSRALRPLNGDGKGIVFRRDGVVEASSTKDDTGWGAVILKDTRGNELRISFAGGTGTVVVEMKDPSGNWTTDLRYWRY
ncbi:MAG: type II secretion system protein [Acidobacteria bacterium]|nr:type II secretion system protein [Acidobacteriota bacterium]